MVNDFVKGFLKVTQHAAIACYPWIGKGDKESADGAAVNVMRSKFNEIDFKGKVIIGEGEKDEAPMLYEGETVGKMDAPALDIAIDPLECTTNLAKGKPNSISVFSAAPEGSFPHLPGTYMNQLAVGPALKGIVHLEKSLRENVEKISEKLGKEISDIGVCVLERERHKPLIKELRELGVKIFLIEHGTVIASLKTAFPKYDIDMMVGIGGAPEAVLCASALKCLGGEIQGMMKPHDEKTSRETKERGFEGKIMNTDDLCKSDDPFFIATGITGSDFLEGVIKEKDNQGNFIFKTSSIVITKEGFEIIGS